MFQVHSCGRGEVRGRSGGHRGPFGRRDLRPHFELVGTLPSSAGGLPTRRELVSMAVVGDLPEQVLRVRNRVELRVVLRFQKPDVERSANAAASGGVVLVPDRLRGDAGVSRDVLYEADDDVVQSVERG